MRWCSYTSHTVLHGECLLAEQTLTQSTSAQNETVCSLNGGMELLGKFIYSAREPHLTSDASGERIGGDLWPLKISESCCQTGWQGQSTW